MLICAVSLTRAISFHRTFQTGTVGKQSAGPLHHRDGPGVGQRVRAQTEGGPAHRLPAEAHQRTRPASGMLTTVSACSHATQLGQLIKTMTSSSGKLGEVWNKVGPRGLEGLSKRFLYICTWYLSLAWRLALNHVDISAWYPYVPSINTENPWFRLRSRYVPKNWTQNLINFRLRMWINKVHKSNA